MRDTLLPLWEDLSRHLSRKDENKEAGGRPLSWLRNRTRQRFPGSPSADAGAGKHAGPRITDDSQRTADIRHTGESAAFFLLLLLFPPALGGQDERIGAFKGVCSSSTHTHEQSPLPVEERGLIS